MTKVVSSYEARTKLSELINLVYYQGIEVVVERMGKPMVRLTRIDEAAIEKNSNLTKRIFALRGSWDNKDGEIIEKNAKKLRSKGRILASDELSA